MDTTERVDTNEASSLAILDQSNHGNVPIESDEAKEIKAAEEMERQNSYRKTVILTGTSLKAAELHI